MAPCAPRFGCSRCVVWAVSDTDVGTPSALQCAERASSASGLPVISRPLSAALPLSALRRSVRRASVDRVVQHQIRQPNFAAMRAAFVARKSELGLTYDRLAELSGIGRRDVWRLSTGETSGTIASWYALAAAVSLPFPELVAHLDEAPSGEYQRPAV